MQADGWTDEDLSRVQQAWASQSFAAGMARSLEGERVFGTQSFDSMHKSNEEAIGMLYGMEEYLPTADWNGLCGSKRCGTSRGARLQQTS